MPRSPDDAETIEEPDARRNRRPPAAAATVPCDAFILANVRIGDGYARVPPYVRRFFSREQGFAETAVVFDVADLLSSGNPPQ